MNELSQHPAHVRTRGKPTPWLAWWTCCSESTWGQQLVPEQAIGASYGDALLAAIGVGLVPPDTDWAKIASEITPDAANSAGYDSLYHTWRELYPATRDLVHRLAADPPMNQDRRD